ncbi:MAG: PAS domain-containing protein, partial [Rhodospirillaceae bacterium]|nr:PAS domain-containing protein [Rhodospirillaceae bacterium]
AWRSWRAEGVLPRRASMRIEDIKALLPGIAILELNSPDELVFRLAGTMMSETLGFELTGANYLDFAPPSDKANRAARAMRQGQQPCGAHFILPMPFSSGRVVMSEVLSLPILPNEDGRAMQLITMNSALEDTKAKLPTAHSKRFAMADEFRFVDIGAGTPEAKLGLTELPHCSF